MWTNSQIKFKCWTYSLVVIFVCGSIQPNDKTIMIFLTPAPHKYWPLVPHRTPNDRLGCQLVEKNAVLEHWQHIPEMVVIIHLPLSLIGSQLNHGRWQHYVFLSNYVRPYGRHMHDARMYVRIDPIIHTEGLLTLVYRYSHTSIYWVDALQRTHSAIQFLLLFWLVCNVCSLHSYWMLVLRLYTKFTMR